MFRSKRTILIAAAALICFALIVFFRYRALQKPLSHEQETYHQGPQGNQQQSLTVAFVRHLSPDLPCHGLRVENNYDGDALRRSALF